MIKQRFTAQELYMLASIAGRENMYGIPDGFAWVPEEELPAEKQQVSDALLDEDVVSMDFDGLLSVSPEYLELVNVYCSCTKCLTINRQSAMGEAEDLIFWQYGDEIYLAEIEEEDYIIRKADSMELEEALGRGVWKGADAPAAQETVIPQIALTKAKRYARKDEKEEALRILRQNGADGRTAAVLLDGLQEKAEYLGVLLMDMSSGSCEKTERAWLSSRGVLFGLGTRVLNFRTCTVFTETAGESVRQELERLASAFLDRS